MTTRQHASIARESARARDPDALTQSRSTNPRTIGRAADDAVRRGSPTEARGD
jgi:hypothetical protein